MQTLPNHSIAQLNDLCRKAPGIACRAVHTQGIAALPDEVRSSIWEKVETFDDFNCDNDPYGEHDFGSFEHEGNRVFWKISYYAKGDFARGSEDPADPQQTTRVLTVMLAEEY